jgi:serine/threonine protein kinase
VLSSTHGPETPVIKATCDETIVYEKVPERIGRYDVSRTIAKGAFGCVYLGHDSVLKRAVAIKVPRADRFSSNSMRQGFIDEAQIAAGLRHPGIVTVYDAALDGEECYIAMEFVEAETLREAMDTRKFSIGDTVELMSRAARAVHFAHKHELVHCDLKPANILVDTDGHPRIADFGLAVKEITQPSREGEIAGTPAYMSPEQVRGEGHRLDGRADIWSLGVILYEMLTGRKPFTHERGRTFDEIINREPKPLRQVDDAIPVALEDICLKCLRKQPVDRYNTALDMAVDLEQVCSDSTRLTGGGSTLRERTPEGQPSWRQPATLEQLPKRTLTYVAVISVSIAVTIGVVGRPWIPNTNPQSVTPSDGKDTPPDNFGLAGPEQPNVGDTVLEPEDPRFQVQRWSVLLDRSPEVLYWLPYSATSRHSWHEERQELSVDSDEIGMFGLGKTNSTHFRLETGIQKNSWSGFAGLFWGYRESTTEDGKRSAECNVVCVNAPSTDVTNVRRYVFKIRYAGDTPMVSSTGFGNTTEVTNPGSSQAILNLEVYNSRLRSIRFDGEEIEGLVDSPELAGGQGVLQSGRFGIINHSGATNFQDARFMLQVKGHNE